MPAVRLGLSGRISGKVPERPRKRSQSVSWNFPREYGWDAPKPVIQGIWGFQSVSRILSPPVGLGTSLFSELVPERASQSWSRNSQQYWGYFWKIDSKSAALSIRGCSMCLAVRGRGFCGWRSGHTNSGWTSGCGIPHGSGACGLFG